MVLVTMKRTSFIKSAVLFVTSYFISDPKEIGGGISEHYVGLYGTFIRKYSKMYKIFWYSVDDNTLRMFDGNGNPRNLTRLPMPLAIFKVLVDARRSSESFPLLTAIIAYYYAAKKKPASFLISLFVFHLLRIMSLVNVMIDIIDPPVEVQITYSESPSLKKIILGTILDTVTLKKGTLMWFCSNSYQKYLTEKYRIPNQRTNVIYDGSVLNLILPNPPKKEGQLTVFYSGALLTIKGVPQLIESIKRLRKKGTDVTLLLTGGVRRPGHNHVEAEDEPWIEPMFVDDWLEWVKILSERADVCVIPYPRKLHWDLTFHMKLPDYMAAGKPIVSMYGTETAYILRKYKCGLIAKNWEEFEEHITRLYEDRVLAKTLGENGRKAVEEFLNYTDLAKTLHKMIQQHLRAPLSN